LFANVLLSLSCALNVLDKVSDFRIELLKVSGMNLPMRGFFGAMCSLSVVSFGTGCGSVADLTKSAENVESRGALGVVHDGDGAAYRTVQIGNQVWMAENLRTSVFANGEKIPLVISRESWANEDGGSMYCLHANEVANEATYGGLYSFAAVVDERGLCPTGWHVPTDKEWNSLVKFLGGKKVAGDAMKAAPTGALPWDGTNSSGFTALPNGFRGNPSGLFFFRGSNGFWWSSSTRGAYAWIRHLGSESSVVYRDKFNTRYGISVRCVQD
jgi:uncharacterized protein (TIGR02145 family)